MTSNTFILTNRFMKDGVVYKIGITQRKAGNKTQIRCENNSVIWIQRYPLGIEPVSEETVICQPSAFMEKDCVCVLVISGKPDIITGLEEGNFLSAKSWERRSTDKLYVMSENAFLKLKPQIESL